jgi:hypothetical protein
VNLNSLIKLTMTKDLINRMKEVKDRACHTNLLSSVKKVASSSIS